jgi:hypothetical protein
MEDKYAPSRHNSVHLYISRRVGVLQSRFHCERVRDKYFTCHYGCGRLTLFDMHLICEFLSIDFAFVTPLGLS